MMMLIPTLWTAAHQQRILKRTRSNDDAKDEPSLWSENFAAVPEENGGRFGLDVVPPTPENIQTRPRGWMSPWKRQKLRDPIGAHQTTSNPQFNDIDRNASEYDKFYTDTTTAQNLQYSSSQLQSLHRFTIRICAGEAESIRVVHDEPYRSINNVLSEAHRERELRRFGSAEGDDGSEADYGSWYMKANEMLGSLHWERWGRVRTRE